MNGRARHCKHELNKLPGNQNNPEVQMRKAGHCVGRAFLAKRSCCLCSFSLPIGKFTRVTGSVFGGKVILGLPALGLCLGLDDCPGHMRKNI